MDPNLEKLLLQYFFETRAVNKSPTAPPLTCAERDLRLVAMRKVYIGYRFILRSAVLSSNAPVRTPSALQHKSVANREGKGGTRLVHRPWRVGSPPS